MKVVGLLYADYVNGHGGTPPGKVSDFVNYLQRDPANWNKLAATAKEFLNSPRNGKPLTIVVGKKLKDGADGSLPWVACESEPVNGKQMMVNLRGNVRLVDPQEATQSFATP